MLFKEIEQHLRLQTGLHPVVQPGVQPEVLPAVQSGLQPAAHQVLQAQEQQRNMCKYLSQNINTVILVSALDRTGNRNINSKILIGQTNLGSLPVRMLECTFRATGRVRLKVPREIGRVRHKVPKIIFKLITTFIIRLHDMFNY